MTQKKEEKGKNPLHRAFAAFMDAMKLVLSPKERSQFCADCSDQVCMGCCPTGAISITEDKGAVIDPAKCTVCYACCRACPMMRKPVEGMEVADYNEKENEMKPEDVSKLVADSVTAALKPFNDQLTAFSESNKKLTEEVSGLRKQVGEAEASSVRKDFEAFCQTPEMLRRVAPASRKSIVDHMMTLRTAEPAEFDDGKGGKIKKSQLDLYQESLRQLPETVQLSEFATGDRAGERGKGTVTSAEFDGAVDEDRLKLHNDALAYQEKHEGVSYEQAVSAVLNKKGGN